LELSAGDGAKTVFCQVRDAVGNAAEPVTASILLDTAGPTITGMRALDGRHTTNNPDTIIVLEASDAHSRVDHVRLSADGKVWGPWQPYGQLCPWRLAGPDGQKEVVAQARDSLGNAGPSANISIVLDTTPPSKPTVTSSTHPSGTVWYNSTVVSLRWTAPQDASGIAGYSFIFTQDNAGTPAEAAMTVLGELSAPVPGEGRWFFAIRAVDDAGNCGAPAYYTFQTDTSGPASPALQSPQANTWMLPGPVQLAWSPASDGQSGIKGYRLQLATDAAFGSTVFDGVVDTTNYQSGSLEEGNYFWRVQACDGAGNWGEYGALAVFTVRKPVPTPATPARGLLDSTSPLMLLVGVILLVAIIAGVALAVTRRRKSPPSGPEAAWPEPAQEQPPVQWEP
jgi:hypothetical protein